MKNDMKAEKIIILVKTPLSFFVFIIFILIEILTLWGTEYRSVTLILIFIVIIIVAVFAWFRPENLLYDAHAYQSRDFGTNKKSVEYREIGKLKPKKR